MILKAKSIPKIPFLVIGFWCEIIRIRLLLFVAYQAFIVFKDPVKALRGLQKLLLLRKSVLGNKKITKMVKVGNRYYWNIDFPGFPSVNLKSRVRNEFIRINTESNSRGNLQTVIWGITSRCSLNCQHCYDWNNISENDKLTLPELIEILSKLKKDGVRHIQLSGGEPINRFDDLISIIELEARSIDFWLLTSGFGLSLEKAARLKNAGLVGINISLDHWDKDKHNTFRGNSKSFEWVVQAIENCQKVGLFVSLSLCATKEFVTKENLIKYACLARNNNVNIIRILEPRSVGRYSGEDVLISNQQVEILEDFVEDMNSNPEYLYYPIINFVGFH